MIRTTTRRLLRAAWGLVAAGMIAACSVAGGKAAPEPEFTVTEADAPFEIRDYPELVLVKTAMTDGSDGAFQRLFRYISGANRGTREIAMTAPVLQQQGTEIAMTAPVLQDRAARDMAFILPAEYTADTAPLPTDRAVRLDVVAPRRVAVVAFAGRATGASVAEATARLEAWMAEAGLVAAGPPDLAQYNPPWTIPALRRNEILIPLARE